MNKYISFFKTCFAPLFIFLLAMTMVFAGCSDDDDDVAKSNHDKKMEAVTAEVQANRDERHRHAG